MPRSAPLPSTARNPLNLQFAWTAAWIARRPHWNRTAPPVVLKIGIRHALPDSWIPGYRRCQNGQSVGVAHWQKSEHTTDDWRHRGVRADAYRDGEHRRRREHWVLPQLPHRVAQVVANRANQTKPSCVAALLLPLLDCTHLPKGGAARASCGEAPAAVWSSIRRLGLVFDSVTLWVGRDRELVDNRAVS